MAIKNTVKEIGETAVVNGSILSVTTFTNLELGLKIILLVITIIYTIDKWWHHKKQRDGKKKKIGK
tara:strand:+ start:1509 stop:1706 length:198 start_codon:yes stop_codon:yes gene_type:complete